MTDQELKDLVASLAVAQRETERSLAEERKRTEEERRKTEEERKRTEDERRKLDAMLAEERKKTEEERRKTEEERRKTEEERRKTEQALRELGKQIGGLGNKFGSFTEGLAMPSLQRLFFERFGCEDFMPRRRKRFGAETIELDALGLANGERNAAYVAEIKSHLRIEGVRQILSALARFRAVFPEYAGMKLYGVIAAADSSEDALKEALDAGLYVVTFEDDLMRFHDERGFEPKAY